MWIAWHAVLAFISARFSRIGGAIVAFSPDHLLDADEFCSSEVEIRDAPTLAQWLDFFNRSLEAYNYVTGWLLELYYAWIWPNYCQCVSPPSPTACAALLSHPHTYANASPDAQNYGFAVEFVPSADVICYGGFLRVSTVGAGAAQHGIDESGGDDLHYLEAVTPTTSDVAYPFAMPQLLRAGHTYKYFYQFPNAGWHHPYDSVSTTPYTNAFATYTLHAYKSPIGASWLVHSATTTPPDPLFCSPSGYEPPIPVEPPEIPPYEDPTCTTTADLCQRVNLLERLILEVRTITWGVSDALAPTCWVPGTTSSALVGAGTLAVTDVVGAYVVLTVPSTWGKSAETPPRHIPKLGELQFAIDGVIATEHQLHYASEQVFGAPPASNTIVYNLRGGVSADITPLLRCR